MNILKLFKWTFLAVLCLFGVLSGCQCVKKEPGPRGGGQVDGISDCSVPAFDWMTIDQNATSTDVAGAAAEIKGAANASLNAAGAVSGSGGIDLGAGFKNIRNSYISRHSTLNVPQDFWEATQKYKQRVCTLEKQLKEGLYTGNLQDIARQKLFEITSGSIDPVVNAHPISNVASGAHRGEAIAYRESDGVYRTKDVLRGGDCEIKPGATITFANDGTASIDLQQSSSYPSLGSGDYWHLMWALGNQEIAGPLSGPHMTSANTLTRWQGSVAYNGAKPQTGIIRWIGDC